MTDMTRPDVEFYTPPALDGLHRPGDILRLRPAPALSGADQAWQILYVSRDSCDQPIPVSATVLTPDASAPDLGGAVLVYYPSFHGLGGPAASQLLATGAEPDGAQIRAALARGFVVAVADGEGLGVIGHGPHTFLAGRAGGQVMLDLARAAVRIPALNAIEPPVVFWGYGDGGRAAVWAGGLQLACAPELDVRGIAAGAVVTDPGQALRSVNRGAWAGLGLAALIGLSHAHRHLPLRHIFTEESRHSVVAEAEVSNRGGFFERYRHPVGVWCERPDVWNDPLWQHVFTLELINATVIPAAPIHLYHGATDAIVPVTFGRHLVHDFRTRGAQVGWREYDGDHCRTARTSIDDVLDQLTEYLTRPTPSESHTGHISSPRKPA
ncbi:lipase family protein [Nocardia africana]|uniref:Lipase family protein n=1 Tax=Nocardia africana TaxID=134964 RepID=A0ABW6NX49_9NOCA